MRVPLLVVTIGLVGVSTAVAQRNNQSEADAAIMKQFVGTWRLVSNAQRLADGTTREGPISTGYIIYTNTNRMCAVDMDPIDLSGVSRAPIRIRRTHQKHFPQ
jgi:hypothetical protein